MTALMAGAGRAAIDYPAATWPLDGFTHQLDELCARVLVVEADERIAWVVVDQTSLPPEPLADVRAAVAQGTDTAPANVLVSVTHTFSAPHLGSVDGLAPEDAGRMRLAHAAVLAAVSDAAYDASRSLRPATVTAGADVCDVNVNRDVELAEGWTLGVNESGFADKLVTAVRIDDEAGAPIALLANYAVQPSVMNESVGADGGRAVTSDLAGAVSRMIERARPGAVGFFLIGAAGDQAPALTAVREQVSADGTRRRLDAGDAAVTVAELLGERLGRAALAATSSATSAPSPTALALVSGSLSVAAQRGRPRERIVPTRAYDYEPAGERALPYVVLVLGPAVVVGVQVELNAVTGQQIRAASPFAHTVVATMVNGGAKYLPEEGSFDRFTYEAQSSGYARGAAEALAGRLAEELAALEPITTGGNP